MRKISGTKFGTLKIFSGNYQYIDCFGRMIEQTLFKKSGSESYVGSDLWLVYEWLTWWRCTLD